MLESHHQPHVIHNNIIVTLTRHSIIAAKPFATIFSVFIIVVRHMEHIGYDLCRHILVRIVFLRSFNAQYFWQYSYKNFNNPWRHSMRYGRSAIGNDVMN